MKIITWNVNGIRAVERKWELQKCIETYAPDILFMQEIKGTPDKFSEYLISPVGYEAFYNPAEKPGYAGTGVWIRTDWRKYVHSIQTGFEWDPNANEGRVIHVTLEKDNTIFDIFGIYFPNWGKSEIAWEQKLIFYKEFSKKIDSLSAEGHIVLWSGDINTAHTEMDLANPKQNEGKIWFHPLERAWLDERISTWWHDIWRNRYPESIEYSWWDQKTRGRERNVGWRIDAFWGNSLALEYTKEIWYLPLQFGSDHCPMWIDIEY